MATKSEDCNGLRRSETKLFLKRIIEILSENESKPWFDVRLKEEYERRHHQCLPHDWTQLLRDCGSDVMEVFETSLGIESNLLIQLPMRRVRPIRSTQRWSEPSYANFPVKAVPKVSSLTPTRIPIRSSLRGLPPTKPPKIPIKQQKSPKSDAKSVAKSSALKTSCLSSMTQLSKALDSLNKSIASKDLVYGGQPIPGPVLPAVNGPFYECVVSHAANPSDFKVIPFQNFFETFSEFQKMEKKMFNKYQSLENLKNSPEIVVRKGLFLAAKTRSKWCRMEVKTVLNHNPFRVVGYLCDYGQYVIVDHNHIQVLDNCFRQLPAQAISATLAHIRPPNDGHWTQMASIVFQDLVEGKPFLAKVMVINETNSHPVLSLSLSGVDDSDVATALVSTGMAKTTNSVI